MSGLIGLRRWETYAALIAVTIGSLSSMADNPKTTFMMIAIAGALVVAVAISLLRRAKGAPKPQAFDPYARAEKIREERERRTRRN
jgi:predicted MFS family arabinose efflux permease